MGSSFDVTGFYFFFSIFAEWHLKITGKCISGLDSPRLSVLVKNDCFSLKNLIKAKKWKISLFILTALYVKKSDNNNWCRNWPSQAALDVHIAC